jgi:formylglycine-generating enzyme required for sulfatase activity
VPKVFISYSRKDMAFVEQLAKDLISAGLDVWWDLSGIRGGEDWEGMISTALESSEHIVVVLSPDSANSRWVRREYLTADEKGSQILPLIYKPCVIPLTLKDRQPVDVQGNNYAAHLPEILEILGGKLPAPSRAAPATEEAISFAEKSMAVLGNRVTIGGIEFIKIPAGKFIMGSKGDNPLAYDNEKPQHVLELSDYWMAKFPLTNEQYAVYVDREKHPVDGWKEKKNHPVVAVSWNDAMAFCEWFNETYAAELNQYGLTLCLPTEVQWEKAARGEYGNEWPWGNEFDAGKCNSIESGEGGTTPVDAYPKGKSPYGVADSVGNIWEWTHTLYREYPYKADKSREDEKSSGNRVMRGGSWGSSSRGARCAYRDYDDPGLRHANIGFRVCLSPA